MKMTKCFFLKIFSLFILSFLPINSFSQQVIDLVISWQEPKIIQHGQELIKVPSIANQSLDGLKPTYFWKEKTSNGKKIELISFESIDALPEETQYLNTFIPELGSIPEINFQITKAGKENYAVVYAAPFFKSSN